MSATAEQVSCLERATFELTRDVCYVLTCLRRQTQMLTFTPWWAFEPWSQAPECVLGSSVTVSSAVRWPL